MRACLSSPWPFHWAVSGACSSQKRKLRARSHWPTRCGQETVVASKPRGFKTQLLKAFAECRGFKNDPGLGPTLGMGSHGLRMGKGQGRPSSAALPAFCSPKPDSSTRIHLIDEVCVRCFGNDDLFLPAKLSVRPSAAPGAAGPAGTHLESLGCNWRHFWGSSAPPSSAEGLAGSAGLRLGGFSHPVPQGLATRTG